MEERLAIVILPDYLESPSENAPPKNGLPNENEETDLFENLPIVILPNYLENEDLVVQKPPPPKKASRKMVKRKPRMEEETASLEHLQKPVFLDARTPVGNVKGHVLFARKKYVTLFNSLIATMFVMLLFNVMVGPINGVGGPVTFDGATSSYSPLNNEMIEPSQLYPCDPEIQSNACRNSLTLFFSEADSMPRGLYTDTFLMFIVLFIAGIAINMWAKSLDFEATQLTLAQMSGFNPIEVHNEDEKSRLAEGFLAASRPVKTIIPLLFLLFLAHVFLVPFDGEGKPIAYNGPAPINHPTQDSSTLNPGQVYPCDASVQVGSCELILRPSFGDNWLMPTEFYPIYAVLGMAFMCILLGIYFIETEILRFHARRDEKERHRIGEKYGTIGLDLLHQRIENGVLSLAVEKRIQPTNLQLITTQTRTGETQIVTQPMNRGRWQSIPNGFHQFRHGLKALPKRFLRFIWLLVKPVRWLVGALGFSKATDDGWTKPYAPGDYARLELSSLEGLQHRRAPTFQQRARYQYPRTSPGEFAPLQSHRLQVAKTNLVRRPSISNHRSMKVRPTLFRVSHAVIRNNLGRTDASTIPYHFIHVDQSTKSNIESLRKENKNVFFVHNRINHNELIDLGRLE